MDQEIIEQTRRKARFCVNRLADYERQYYAVVSRRRKQDNVKAHPKSRMVNSPVTIFTRRCSFFVLMGNFDAATLLIADLKRIQNMPMGGVMQEFYTPRGNVHVG